jgi:hypothetical protein
MGRLEISNTSVNNQRAPTEQLAPMQEIEEAEEYLLAIDQTVPERGPRCLPVAELDEAFDGQPRDGAEYLAMIQFVIELPRMRHAHLLI